jgi:hypothetical protein
VPANRPALREGDSFSSLGAGQTSDPSQPLWKKWGSLVFLA